MPWNIYIIRSPKELTPTREVRQSPKELTPIRELRQNNPIPSFLFLIVTTRLVKMVR